MNNPWVIITGGTGGIGKKLCSHAASSGFRVAIGYRRNRSEAETLARDHDGEAVALDLCAPDQIDSVVARFSSELVKAVILNASPPLEIKPFIEATGGAFHRQFEVTVVGHHRLLAGLIKSCFRPTKTGTVVAVLTKAMGDMKKPAMKDVSVYIAAKYGLLGLVVAARAEHPWLKVETVSPGFTDTPMLDAFNPRFVELLREQGMLSDPDVVAKEIISKIASSG